MQPTRLYQNVFMSGHKSTKFSLNDQFAHPATFSNSSIPKHSTFSTPRCCVFIRNFREVNFLYSIPNKYRSSRYNLLFVTLFLFLVSLIPSSESLK